MEKFTNPKRGNTRVGSICMSRHVGPTTNEHILPFLLVVLLFFFIGNLVAQPFNQQLTTSNPLNGIDVGSRSVPVFVDIDNDCDKDLFVGTQAGEILFFLNKGTASVPNFIATTGSGNPMDGFTVSSNAKPAFVDIDADGDLDCFVGTGDGTITAYKNEGDVFTPNFVEQTGPNSVFFDGNPFDGEDVGANASPVFLDFDFDGDYDCFVGRSNGTNSIRYYRNEDSDYNPVFNELTGGSNPLSNALLGGVGANGDITSNACLTAADFGNDGDLDIYVGVASGVFRYFRNNGSSFTHFGSGSSSSPLDNGGTPNPKDISASGTDYSSPTFVDIDGDGDLDCFSGRNPGTFVYYRNDAPLTARVITCAPTYVVNLNANGTVTVDPSQVDYEDLFVSTTFTCINELEFTVTGTGILSFTCADADNTAMSNGAAEYTVGMPPTSLVLTATDEAMNTATCSSTITVVDKTPPVPNVASLPAQSIDICSVANFPASYIPTATDACPTTAVNGVASPGSLAAMLGQTTVTWTYTDSHGNTSTQTQVFNVVSNTAPTWTNCPTDIGPLMENQGAPNCGYIGNLWTIPTPNDCEAIVSMNSSHSPTSFFPVGITTVSYAAQDAGGNTGYCNFTVTVTDGIPPSVTVNTGPRSTTIGNPVIANGSTVSLNSTQGVCGAAFSWLAPDVTATDNCGGNVSLTSSHPSGYTFPVGSSTVYFWATDAGSNTTTYWTFIVNVTDIQPPSLTCPVSITIPTAPNSCTSATINLTLPNATDNCPGLSVVRTTDGTFATASPAMEQPPLALSMLPLGAHSFFFRATDASANSATCSYTITVVDAQAPTFGITCPQNQTVPADMNGCTKTVTWTVPTATDNCTLVYTPTATLTGGNTSTSSVAGTAGMPVSAVFNEGITTVTYYASDAASPANSASCSFTVKVTNTVPPSVSCPVSPVVVAAGSNCLYTLGNPGATSSAVAPCDPGTVTYRLASNNTALTIGLSTFPLGTHTLRAVATDASGNTATCTFNIQVTDQTGPTLQAGSCPANITVNSDVAANCGANVTWSAPIWTDNCNNAGIVISRAASPGNMSTPNTATLLNSNAGGYFPVGVTQVNFTAKDGPAITANIGTPCGFTVTVIDDDAPVLSNCPTSPVVLTATDYPNCNNTYNLPVPTVSDYGCNNALPVYYSTAGALVTATTALVPSVTLPLGTTVITYSASDAATNRGTCSFSVQVRDLTGPAFSCPSNQIIVLTSGCSGPAANWADPTLVTDCSTPVTMNAPVLVSTTGTPAPTLNGTSVARNGVFPVGVTTLRYVANDNAGNSSSCTFTIDVRENTAPVITCPATQVIAANSGCNANVTQSMLNTPTVSDNCGTPQLALLSPSLPSLLSGTFVVFWQATDASGNTAVCSSNVTIQDQTPPTLTCGTFTVQVDVPGNNFIPSSAPTFIPQAFINVSDNCASVSLGSIIANPPVLPQYPVGTSFIYWQVSDGVSTTTCSQTIVVTPNPTSCTPTTPSFTGGSNCGSPTPFVLPNANCPTTVTVTAAQLGLSATDNCGNPLSLANQSFNVSVSGNQTVTFTATVGSNSATCVRTVSVTCNSGPCTPTAVPTFAGCGGSIAVNANASCQGVVSNFGVTASDNCGSRVVTASNNGPFPLGTTIVTFTASNTVGPNSCTKTVVVSDVTPPTFVSCPDVTIDAEPGEEFALSINLEAPLASDNCSVSSVLLAQGTPELLFGDGEVVTWVVTDGSGNPTECQQNVSVNVNNGGGSQACTDALGIELATDGAAGDWYGNSVDVDGSRAIIGAPYDDNGKGTNSGAAYILEKDVFGNWTQVAKLVVPDGDADDLFGQSVAIDGGLVIVGANKYAGKGAAFIFSGSGATWTLTKKLLASDGAANDDYGISVDITGTHAIVGADLDDVETKVDQGSVYIYSAATSWGGEVKRIASDGGTNDNFGISVALDGNNAVVGSRYDDDFGVNCGAAYIFSKDQGGTNNWGQATKLTASDASAGDYFGSSVAISGNQVIVGSYLDDYSMINNAGSAYIFQGSGASWPEVAKLVPSDAAPSDQFGSSVSIEAGIALIGSQFDDDMGTNSGSAYVFTEGSGWAQVNKLTGASVAANDNFGHSVAIGGNSIVIGAYKDDVGAALDQGSAYFFGCTNTPQRPATQERTSDVTTGGQVNCFPNPSTDMVNIDITLATEESVQVLVSDVSGKIVTTLFDGKMSGENRLQWEGKQFGNGMFFIRIQSASLRETVPVVIIR
ncbi:MAG: HYR domain-containing protein [Bacteroidetes bacterium]|nr:HYR domain-containing protein [Bacteroidota bacterium]